MSSLSDLPEWVRDNQAYRINLDHGLSSDKGVQQLKPVPANVGGTANVISSRIAADDDFHTPMLDLDIPHRLIPSSTPGHSHLYIDVLISKRKYGLLLQALWDAGIIQRGILDQFDTHGATFLRLPDVKKTSDPLPF